MAPFAPLVAVACPACFGALAVGSDLAGQPADCPLCGGGFRVPPLAQSSTARSTSLAPESAPDASPSRQPDRQRESRQRGAARQDAAAPAPSATATFDEGMVARSPEADAELAVREPVLTVGSGAGEIVLRRLSPAERAARRTRRNLVMLVGGVSILLTIVLLLGRKR
jgi:hypothetical protein